VLRISALIVMAVAMSLSPINPQVNANAADVKLLSAAVMKPVLLELASEYERTTGHKLTITYESAGVVRDRVQAGENADVAIIQRPVVEALLKQGKFRPGSTVTLARSGVGVAVRAGAVKPTSVLSKRSSSRCLRKIRRDPAAGPPTVSHLWRARTAGDCRSSQRQANCREHSLARHLRTMAKSASSADEFSPRLDSSWPAGCWAKIMVTWAMGVTSNAKGTTPGEAELKFLSRRLLIRKGGGPGAQWRCVSTALHLPTQAADPGCPEWSLLVDKRTLRGQTKIAPGLRTVQTSHNLVVLGNSCFRRHP
jgi:hypothetical protein